MNKLQTKSYLEAITRFGNISNAAKHLYVSQPYLSKVIKELESEVGVKMINRESNPLTLTYAGERYLAYLEEMEMIQQKMEYELQEIANLEKGRLKIGVNPFLASHTLYTILPEFINSYPGIEIELIEDNANQIEVLLADNKIDISLTILPITYDEITYETLYSEAFYLAVPKNYKIVEDSQNKVTQLDSIMKQLHSENFILLKKNMTLRAITDKFFTDYHVVPKPVMETINIDNALYLADAGIGLTIVPESVKDKATHGNLHYFKLDESKYRNHVVVAFNKNHNVSKAASVFLNLAKMRFKENQD